VTADANTTKTTSASTPFDSPYANPSVRLTVSSSQTWLRQLKNHLTVIGKPFHTIMPTQAASHPTGWLQVKCIRIYQDPDPLCDWVQRKYNFEHSEDGPTFSATDTVSDEAEILPELEVGQWCQIYVKEGDKKVRGIRLADKEEAAATTTTAELSSKT